MLYDEFYLKTRDPVAASILVLAHQMGTTFSGIVEAVQGDAGDESIV